MNTLSIFFQKNTYTQAIFVFLVQLTVLPVTLFAQTNTATSTPTCATLLSGSINNLKDIIDFATCLITKSVVPLLFTIAIVVFVYGVIQYFLNPNNIGERIKARQYIIFALLGMFVIFSVGGIIEILRNTFGVSTSVLPLLPETQ